MTILVTGGAGYIGSHMALELIDKGERVVVLDNLSTGFRWAVPAGATFVEGDVGDQRLIGRLVSEHGIKAIAHFAAKIVVPESVADPLGYYANNTMKSRALVEAAVKSGVKHMIFSSTAAVYGDTGDAPVREDGPVNPVSPYGRSKLMTEWMLADTARAHDFSYVTLRYFNVAGGDPKERAGQSTPHATHLIKVACQVALGERPHLDVFGTDYPTRDGTCVRDYIQVSDLARAHIAALEHLTAGGDSLTLNCGYGRGYSVKEVVETVRQVSGKDFKVRFVPRRPGDPASIVANVEKIRETLGWRPDFDRLEAIVAQALAWERHLIAKAA
jgi:UDP-glucose 4-epimerase